jgi:hypothetical protein
MAEMKTKPNDSNVGEFLDRAAGERRDDCEKIAGMMTCATGAPPVMWGDAIVGFGIQHLKYESGRELEWMLMGFSPRKTDISFYLSPGANSFPDLLKKLGKHKMGKSCLYVRKLADINIAVLQEILNQSAHAAMGKTS